jgi:hypothetical protein
VPRFFFFLALLSLISCRHGRDPGQVSGQFREAVAAALEALDRANDYRDNSASLFDARYLIVEKSTFALGRAVDLGNAAEEHIFSDIVACSNDLKSYREASARNDIDATQQAGAIVDGCLDRARKGL